jgi:hypothetical protein
MREEGEALVVLGLLLMDRLFLFAVVGSHTGM